MEASAPKVDYKPDVLTPKPRWIVRDKNGYAPGINILRLVGLFRFVVPPRIITGLQFKQYRKIALLNGVRGSPGQIYTSSIYYLEGYIESAYAVSVRDAPADDRHLLGGGPADAAALDQPGPALPRLAGDAGLHPARADHGGVRVRDDPRRALPRVRAPAGRRRSGRPASATRCTGRRTPGSTRSSSSTCTAPRRSRAGRRRGRPSSATTRRLMKTFETDAMAEAGLA